MMQRLLFTCSIVCLAVGSQAFAHEPLAIPRPTHAQKTVASVGVYVSPLDSVGKTGLPSGLSGATYQLDQLGDHPYNYLTARDSYPDVAPASANPGSPRYFTPGYGYRLPFFDLRLVRFGSSNRYLQEYGFGNRIPRYRTDRSHRNWTNAYGGPWYYPGASTNTVSRTFAW